MKRLVLVAAAVVAVLGVGSFVGPGTGSAAPAPTVNPDVVAGRRLFEVGCTSCHGFDARGTRQGPSLVNAGAASADFYLTTGRMPLDYPGQQAVRKHPAYTPTEIRQLVTYVGSLGTGPPIPPVGPGNVERGNALYGLNCAPCHSALGAGGALGFGDIVPSLYAATGLQIREAMRIGPGPMPVFGPNSLTDQQVNDIATYVKYLQHPRDRGGASIGRFGPVPEGFVAWVAGIGVLLLAARIIGTRAS